MKICLVEKYQISGTKIYSKAWSQYEGQKMVLTIPVNIQEADIYEYVCSNENDPRSEGYVKILTKAAADCEYYGTVCIHILAEQDDENEVSVVLDGLFWDEENKGLLFEGLKLRVQLSLASLSLSAEKAVEVKETGLLDTVVKLEENEVKRVKCQMCGEEAGGARVSTRVSKEKSVTFPLAVVKDAMECVVDNYGQHNDMFINACVTLTLFSDEGENCKC